jgi:uncharacterized membrane protein
MNRKPKDTFFPTNRMEAFSDGVIAIIITLMILEVKPPHLSDIEDTELKTVIVPMLPHLVAYSLSFLMLGIYWVNHHNFFHKVKHGDRPLLWLNLNLLFWMSLIPLPTLFIGSHFHMPIASVFYGMILFATSISFTYMGIHADKNNLFTSAIPEAIRKRNMQRNKLSLGLYVVAMGAAYLSVYVSFAIFILVAAMYFMPKLGIINKDEDASIPQVIVEDLLKVEEKIENAIESKVQHHHEQNAEKNAANGNAQHANPVEVTAIPEVKGKENKKV